MTEIDGTDRYLDETGNILRNHMTRMAGIRMKMAEKCGR